MARLQDEVFANLTAWQRAQIARHPSRPYSLDYIRLMLTDFLELHGDRGYADDRAIVGGLARLDGMPLVVIGQQKGRDTKEKLMRNFAMAHPEGYRKALRLMRLAEKFRRPILTLVDTPGAYPGIGAEERGQAEAIARNLREMAHLPVPVVVAIVGEGGSGGALGLAVGDRVLMLEYAIYSVISPEGCASILWRDPAKAPEAAAAMRITAHDLQQLGLIDGIVPEPVGGAHRNHPEMVATPEGGRGRGVPGVAPGAGRCAAGAAVSEVSAHGRLRGRVGPGTQSRATRPRAESAGGARAWPKPERQRARLIADLRADPLPI